MTISDLRRALNKTLEKSTVVSSKKHDMGLYLSRKDWTTAKYACTTEENDFKFISGTVYFKGFELKIAQV